MNKALANLLLIIATIVGLFGSNFAEASGKTPSWFLSPKQNNDETLYGIASGKTMEEATKYALVDAAARLIVSISSESNLVREENNQGANEEMRQKVKQNIEKISFTNFEINKSEKSEDEFFVEVKIQREPFINQQKEQIEISEKKIANLDKNSANKNPIARREALLKITNLTKEIELKGRILEGAQENIGLKEKLLNFEKFNNELAKTGDDIEFFFDPNSPKEITKIIRNQLNKEKIKVSPSLNTQDRNQILIKISSESRNQKIYDYSTKIEIDFSNSTEGKIIASNSIEVIGNSVISESESYKSALKSLEEKVSKDGAFKTLGIIN